MEQWQRSLRRQTAVNERIRVIPPAQNDPDGYFTVISGKSGKKYHVVHRGESSRWNYCSCPDFRTNRLGTCKHLEAINEVSNGRYARRIPRESRRTSVYIDYRGERCVRIHYGGNNSDEMRKIAEPYFDGNGILRIEACSSFEEFMTKAQKIEPEIRCFSDAMDFILEKRQLNLRKKILTDNPEICDTLLKAPLYPYQKDGVKFAFRNGRVMIADEMGLGKTIQAIATAELLRKNGLINSVLIICPTSLKFQWQAEIKRFTDQDALIIDGLSNARAKLLGISSFYKIGSYNSVANDITYGVVPDFDLIIYDEVHRLKNWDTKMARAMRALHSEYVIALSGTPFENKLSELYSVMQLVDQYCLGPYWKFTADTTLMDHTGRVTGYKNLATVGNMLRDTVIRRRKPDVLLQMPERTDQILFVPMTPEQMALHNEYQGHVSKLIHRWHKVGFLPEKERKRLMLFLSMMRMVCDSTFMLDQESRHDTKIEEVVNIITEITESGKDKIVVFSQWERMLRLIAHELEKLDIEFRFLHGSVPSAKRGKLIDDFIKEPSCRVFLSTDTGSSGLNLQVASVLINVDLPWNPAVLEQRIARIHRIGQSRHIQIINLVSRGTIEERMLETLKFKRDMFHGVMDGGEDSIVLDNNKFRHVAELVEEIIPVNLDEKDLSIDNVSAEISPQSQHSIEKGSLFADLEDFEDEAPTLTPVTENVAISKTTSIDTNFSASEASEVINAGVNFLTGLASMLQTEEGKKKLLDSIVRTNPETGETSVSISVPNKKAVSKLINALASLLSQT